MKKFILLVLVGFPFKLLYSQSESRPEFESAVKLLQARDYKQAIVAFSNLLPKVTDPQVRKFCYIYRAFSYNGVDDFKSAIKDLDMAIQIDPIDLRSYTDRGKTKAYLGDIDGASKDFLFILSRDSTGDQAQAEYFYLAKIAYNQGEMAQSIKYYDKLLTLMPTDSEAYFNRGVAKGMIMDVAGSIKDYDKAIELNPEYMEAYANRGVSKINLIRSKGNIQPTKGETRDACADLKKAKQMGDTSVDDMLYLFCERK